jgi:hypothetical protein
MFLFLFAQNDDFRQKRFRAHRFRKLWAFDKPKRDPLNLIA